MSVSTARNPACTHKGCSRESATPSKGPCAAHRDGHTKVKALPRCLVKRCEHDVADQNQSYCSAHAAAAAAGFHFDVKTPDNIERLLAEAALRGAPAAALRPSRDRRHWVLIRPFRPPVILSRPEHPSLWHPLVWVDSSRTYLVSQETLLRGEGG